MQNRSKHSANANALNQSETIDDCLVRFFKTCSRRFFHLLLLAFSFILAKSKDVSKVKHAWKGIRITIFSR
jgi:hypothetical protein